MSAASLSFVFLGLSLRSSWGNGHATTYRALIKALHERGHRVVFLERDVPWYADNADVSRPGYCRLELYSDLAELRGRHGAAIRSADVVVVGSYVPEGPAVARFVLERARGLVGFYDIDTPVTMAMLDRGEEEYLALDLVPAFDFYLSFTNGPCLERLRTVYGARLPVSFPCMVDPAVYRRTGDAVAWDLGYLGTYSPDRQPALERLLIEPARRMPERRFVVAGAKFPRDIAWPPNVERIEHVAPDEHARFYSRLRFALNVTRANMRAAGWSPSVRLFEAAACGTAILTDRWEGLDSFFPVGEAVLAVDGPEDVLAALSTLDADEVRSLARRAREIVLAEHTGGRRAEELENVIARLMAGRTMEMRA